MQILIWGDEMKRNIGICIIVLFIIAVGVTFWRDTIAVEENELITNEGSIQTDTEAMIKTNADVKTDYNYYIGNKNGNITVYNKDKKTIYLETDILYESLPDDMKGKIDSYLGFNNLKEVFAFLESYSS